VDPDPATITVTKDLIPFDDAGRFFLQVDNISYTGAVGDGGTTGPVTVPPGGHTVGELSALGTSFSDYVFDTRCDENPADGLNPLSPVINNGISGAPSTRSTTATSGPA
jgi:hypothetical protein